MFVFKVLLLHLLGTNFIIPIFPNSSVTFDQWAKGFNTLNFLLVKTFAKVDHFTLENSTEYWAGKIPIPWKHTWKWYMREFAQLS